MKDANVAALTGIGKSTFSDWKSGRSEPKNDKLQKIADCLGVSVNYFTDEDCDQSKIGYYINDETAEIAQIIYENKDMKILFDVARKSKPEHLKAYAKFLMDLRDKEEGKN